MALEMGLDFLFDEDDFFSCDAVASGFLRELPPAIQGLSKGEFHREIYPLEAVAEMIRDHYNPWIIGDIHDTSFIGAQQQAVSRIKGIIPGSINGRKLVMVQEILPPVQLRYIKDFLEDEREFNQTQTIKGKPPSKSTITNLRSYRGKLQRHHAESMCLWSLDNNFEVHAYDEEDALPIIRSINRDFTFREKIASKYGRDAVGVVLQFYCDILRDISAVRRINRIRPDIICVGSAHAWVLDQLLERDGSKSVCVPAQSGDLFNSFLPVISAAQGLYLKVSMKKK